MASFVSLLPSPAKALEAMLFPVWLKIARVRGSFVCPPHPSARPSSPFASSGKATEEMGGKEAQLEREAVKSAITRSCLARSPHQGPHQNVGAAAPNAFLPAGPGTRKRELHL